MTVDPNIYEGDDNFYDEDELNSSDESENVEGLKKDKPKETKETSESVLEIPDEIEDEASLAQEYSIALDLDLEMEDSDDDVDDTISPEERLRMFSDQIMSCMVGESDTVTHARNKLLSVTNPRLFRDENHILFTILYNYRSKLRYLNIDEEFIRLFLSRNRKLLTKAKAFIDVNAYGEVDGSPELGYIAGVCKHYKRLLGMPSMNITQFETAFEKYLIEFKALEATKVYRQAQQILTDGLRVGNKEYIGFEDSVAFSRKRIAEIEGLVDFDSGSGFTKMSEILGEEKEDGKKSVLIGDFGDLTPLNKSYGGIYTGMFYQIIAPPKGGKTKLCARICHNVSVIAGNNVTVWAQEGGKEAWTAQMRAIHFDYTYNSGATDLRDCKFGVTQDVILKDKWPSEELKQLELSSKLDLRSNSEYGSIDFIDRPFVVETFIDDIDTSVRENGSRIVIIDYLQLIGSNNNLTERERVAEAYKSLLIYCKNHNVAVLTPGQYKQESLNAMLAKTDVSDADLRSAGGTSSEVERTPDVIFALWASANDIQNNKMKILSVPSRMNVMFPAFDVALDLGTCKFVAVD